MGSVTIRVDQEVYETLMGLKWEAEHEAGRAVSFNDVVRSALQLESNEGGTNGNEGKVIRLPKRHPR